MTALPPEIVDSLAGRRILILGDLVADQFLNGMISRVSREAPVFILRHEQTETRAGGAANAAVNVASLGGIPIVIGCIGDDQRGELLCEVFSSQGISTDHLVEVNGVETTTKIRVLAGHQYALRQQVIRIDHEMATPLPDEASAALRAHLEANADSADAILVSDYGYGVVTPHIFQRASDIARERSIPIIIDSRFRLGEFPGATSATPNQEEAEQLLGGTMNDDNCEALREKLGLQALLVTRGNKGMELFEAGRENTVFDSIGAKEPVDVTGAGDTVIAAYSLALAAGLSFQKAAALANHAGGIVVMKKGTAAASADELRRSLAGSDPDVALGSASSGTK